MFDSYSRKIAEFETRLLIKRPLLWILKFHWVLRYIAVSLVVSLAFGFLMPFWTNPISFVVILSCINLLVSFYWNRRIETYSIVLFSTKSRILVHFGHMFLFIIIFCIPFIVPSCFHQRGTKIFGDAELFSAAIPLVVNHEFVMDHYDELVILNEVIDSVSRMEEHAGTTKSFFFSREFIRRAGKDSLNFFLDKHILEPALRNFFLCSLNDRERVERVVENITKAGDSIYQNRLIPRDTFLRLKENYKYITAIRNPITFQWIKSTTPWGLFNSMAKNYPTIVTNLGELNEYVYSAQEEQIDLFVFGYNSNMLSKLKTKKQYEEYYSKVCRIILQSNGIKSKKDIALLGKYDEQVINALNGRYTSDASFLIVVTLLLTVLACNLTLVKQVRGFKVLFQVLVGVVVLIVFGFLISSIEVLFTIDSYYIDEREPWEYYVLVLSAVFYFILLSFLATDYDRFNKLQNKLLPHVLTLSTFSLLGLVLLASELVSTFELINKLVKEFSQLLLILLIFIPYLLTIYFITKKFIRFYISPQAK